MIWWNRGAQPADRGAADALATGNDAALRKRKALPPGNDFGIEDLLAMPPYWGWVDCETGAGPRFTMFLGGADDGVALRFFWNGSYEKETLRIWTELAKRSRVTVDVGAHTGAYTLAALACGQPSRVLSFEPHFMNYARLNLNLRANGRQTSDAEMVAVGAKEEVLPFTVRTSIDYLTAGGSIGAAGTGRTTDIRVVALDAFLPHDVGSAVGLVKLDVEGFEGECFKGMQAIVARAGPTVFFECIETAAGAAVHAALAPLGYLFYEVDDRAETVTQVDSVAPVLDAQGRVAMERRNRIASRDRELLSLI